MDKTCRQWLEENKSLYNTREELADACANELGLKRNTVRKKLSQVWPVKSFSKDYCLPDFEHSSKSDIIATEEFLKSIDVVARLSEFLDENVGDNYIEDEKLRRRMEVSKDRWREIKTLPKFSDRVLTYDCGGGRKKTVWSSVEGISAAKGTISLARYE